MNDQTGQDGHTPPSIYPPSSLLYVSAEFPVTEALHVCPPSCSVWTLEHKLFAFSVAPLLHNTSSKKVVIVDRPYFLPLNANMVNSSGNLPESNGPEIELSNITPGGSPRVTTHARAEWPKWVCIAYLHNPDLPNRQSHY